MIVPGKSGFRLSIWEWVVAFCFCMLVTALPASFKPEQRRAYTAFSSNYAKRDTRVRLEGVSFVSGEANFFNNHVAVRNVPIADGYTWTQTQAKKEFLVPDSPASVSFWKIISRRKDHALSEIPPHKLWMFHISNPEEPPYSMIWCEKGFASRSEEHTSELQSRQSISYAVFCL